MVRLAAALAAVLAALPAAAQDAKKPADDLDAKTRAAIEKAVEKAKEDLRNEVRAELQGAQSASEFLGAVAEGPKLEFFQVDGYLRSRGQLFDGLSLGVGRDPTGRYLFPIPFDGGEGRQTLASANMRLRLEPTLNVSEHVRVRAQLDVLDNSVYGSSTSLAYDGAGSPYPVPFYGSTRVASGSSDPRNDRPAIQAKRVWAEVQTPVGLLSFGRMPSEWGMGVLANAGRGLDDDLGDTVDRMQFALPPVATPLGRLTFVPILDFDNTSPVYAQPWTARGTGQPYGAESGSNGRTYALKVVRLDTDDELRRKLERSEASVNYGAYYNYRTQRYLYPDWNSAGFDASYAGTDAAQVIHRAAYAHIVDFWFRLVTARFKLEAEGAGVYGTIGDPRSDAGQPAPTDKILLRQWGGAVNAEYKVIPNKFTWGGEAGVASGDEAPGFGNAPGLGYGPPGSYEGAQWSPGTDRSIRNFRFNPAYRVDLILFHTILGGVTDAFYLKPKFRWDIIPGLSLDGALVYSRALDKASTPSAANGGGSRNLGLEADFQLSYGSGDGFHAWVQWGVLQPLGGLEPPGRSASRAQLLAVGVAAKF